MRTLHEHTPVLVGQTVTVNGWVHAKRDHSKVLFIDLRDRSGLLQVVTGSWNPEAYAALKECGIEDVLEITGMVAARPEKLVNPEIVSGTVELQAETMTVLNRCALPPFEINQDTLAVDEELRMKYRYLDLRSERMHANLIKRAKVVGFLRRFLDERGFTEVETPLLTASTPEGARDYLVPSRLEPGACYALPQSPQQYKQLLMVAGIERYYQIAKCLRDEDSRGDRQPEFTQLDMELSFATQEEIMQLNEELLIALVTELFPSKKIQQIPFPRISYKEAMEKYGTDRPDVRENPDDPQLLAFCWVIDFPFFESDDKGGWTFTHNPFSQARSEHLEWLKTGERIGEILTTQYDIALNGYEIGGGSLRAHHTELLRKTFEIMGYSEDRIEESFAHMLSALTFGAPPHGGIAWGLERLLMLLQGEPNIREVMAFPKTGEGRDPMMHSPAQVATSQLADVGLQLKP